MHLFDIHRINYDVEFLGFKSAEHEGFVKFFFDLMLDFVRFLDYDWIEACSLMVLSVCFLRH